MADKPDWFKLYPSRFLQDGIVDQMTTEELGCCVRLMCRQWLDGSIPDDLDRLARICRVDGSGMGQASAGRCLQPDGWARPSFVTFACVKNLGAALPRIARRTSSAGGSNSSSATRLPNRPSMRASSHGHDRSPSRSRSTRPMFA